VDQYQASPTIGADMANQLPRSAELSGRLLVIDDDRSASMLIAKLGECAGFSATSAASCEEAEQLLQSSQFDCITLDLNIGKNSGIGILKLLASMASKTPIIVISGSGSSFSELARAVGNMLQLNLLQPLPKPIDFAKLKAAFGGIKQGLDQKRAAVPTA
jgi:two-component system OmpR family response regulator